VLSRSLPFIVLPVAGLSDIHRKLKMGQRLRVDGSCGCATGDVAV
jgi:hypothetical protein